MASQRVGEELNSTNQKENEMQEVSPLEAMRQVNEQMGGGVFVDENKMPTLLDDLFNELHGDDLVMAENDPVRVIVEYEEEGTATITVIDEQDFRVGLYGTIYAFDVAQRLGY